MPQKTKQQRGVIMDMTRVSENTYRFDEEGVRFFLLLGEEKALLIDSGMQVHNAKELVQKVTDLPIELFNTHADIDHIGSNSEFDSVMMAPAELVNYRMPHTSQTIFPVYDGDIIDLGGRRLKAIALPGHTPGSTALLDISSGMLFSGDPIQDGRIFMFGPMRDISAYILSLKRLLQSGEQIRQIYPSHGSCPLDMSIVPKLIEGAQKVERRELSAEPIDMFGNRVGAYDIGCAVLLCDE